MKGKIKIRKENLRDLSLWILVLSNLATILFAVREGWGLPTLLWIYWAQSVIIGIFSFLRIIALKDFSAKKLDVTKLTPSQKRNTKILMACFFAFHYGFFHFVYALFLVSFYTTRSLGKPVVVSSVIVASAIFFANHLFSFLYNKAKDTRAMSIDELMTRPYSRIVPMHLTIMLTPLLPGSTVLFLGLKTVADAVSHIKEHSSAKENPQQERNENTLPKNI